MVEYIQELLDIVAAVIPFTDDYVAKDLRVMQSGEVKERTQSLIKGLIAVICPFKENPVTKTRRFRSGSIAGSYLVPEFIGF